MKRTTHLIALLSLTGSLAVPAAHAATATWTQFTAGNASGSWNVAANPPWSTGAIPGAADFADFNTFDITGTNNVTLDASQSISGLVFGDTVTTSTGIWFVSRGASDTADLTLVGDAPQITVNALGNGRVWMDVPLAGTGGLTKLGTGILTLTNGNTFTGGVRILGGTLGVGFGDGCLGAVPDTLIPDNIYLNGGILYNLRSGALLSNPTISSNRGLTIGPAGGTLNVNNAGQVMTLVGPVTGGGLLTKIGAGRASLAGQMNTFTGPVIVTAGSLAYALNGGSFGNNPATFVADSVTLNGGALNNNGNSALVNWTMPANRGVTLGANAGTILADSTSGNVTISINSVISGGALRKGGLGGLILNAANTYTGGTIVSNGPPLTATTGAALMLGNAAALGSGAVSFVNSNSHVGLRYAAATNGLVPNNFSFSTTNNVTNRWVVDANRPATFSGLISGGHATSTWEKEGDGTLFLAANNTVAGTLRVARGGVLGVTGGSCSNTPVVLEANYDFAKLGVRVTDPTRPWSCPSLTCNVGAVGPMLEFIFNVEGSKTVAPLRINGRADFNTMPGVIVRAGALSVTTGNGYPLMTWDSMTGTPPDSTLLQLYPAGWVQGSLSVVGNTLYLQITATTEPLRWAAGNGTWDTVSYAANWMNSATPPYLTFYQDGDVVQFEDTQNPGGGVITIDGPVSPASTLVNSANDYTLTGTANAIIAGDGSLTKTGPGKLTISGPGGNTFSGGLTVSAGTLIAAKPNGTAYGVAGNGSVVVQSGATVVADGDNSFLGQATAGNKTLTIHAGGTVTNTGTSSGHLNRLVLNGGTLGANTPNPTYGNWNLDQGVATLGSNSVSQIVGGNVTLSQIGGTIFNILGSDTVNVYSPLERTLLGNDTGLIKNGNGVLNLFNSCTSTGLVTLNGGTLRVGTDHSLPSGLFTLGAGITIASTDGSPRTITNTLSSGIASAILNFGDATGTGPLTFTGPFGFLTGTTGRGFVTQTDVDFTGPITGANGPLTKTGPGTLTISGVASVNWSGGWNINTGGLRVNGSLVTTSSVNVANSAWLGGNGLVDCAVNLSPGAILAPGASIGTLTLSQAPSWAGAVVQMEVNQTNSQTADKLLRTSGGFDFTGAILTVQNQGPALTVGTFTLFSAGNTGAFAATNLPPLAAGLTWDFSKLASDGTLTVLGDRPSTPTDVTWSLNGNQLTLSWPANYLGWTLQSQTNSLGVGLTSNWTDVPGTSTVTTYTITVNPANPAVFYRLRY